MGALLAISAAAMFALGAIFIRRGQAKMDGERGLVISTAVNVVLNGIAVLLRWAWTGRIGFSWTGLGFFILGGLLTTLIGRWLWFLSIRRIGPARAGAFKVSQPLFTLTFAIWVLGERADAVSLLGLGLTLAGLYLVSLEAVRRESAPVAAAAEGPSPRLATGPAAAPGPGDRLRASAGLAGVGFGVASAVSFAAGNISRKAGVMRWGEPVVGAFVGASVALSGFLGAGLAQGRLRELLRLRMDPGVSDFLWVGLTTSLAQFGFFGALQLSPVWLVNTLGALEPVFVMALAPLLLAGAEPLTRRSLGSIALACAGVAVLSLR